MKKPSDVTDNEVWTISRLIQWTSDYFLTHDIDSPRMTAELLLADVLGVDRLDLYLQFDKPLLKEELGRFRSFIKRRIRREPVAYITGKKGFWTLELEVNDAVLIPRPDTECLVESALSVIPEQHGNPPLNILDLGTGSGAVVLALASERPGNFYYGVDLSHRAIHIARKNSVRNGLVDDVSFLAGRWFGPFAEEETFDVVVSNPPYIPTSSISELQPEITEFEPVLALDGDEDGLSCLRHIIFNALTYLKSGGWLLLETGFDQREGVDQIVVQASGYEQPEYINDFGGNHRVVRVRKK